MKNIGLQIEAMAEVLKKYPLAQLWIVGDGPEKGNLRFKIANLKLKNSVKLLGWKEKEEMAEIYKKTDIFLLLKRQKKR